MARSSESEREKKLVVSSLENELGKFEKPNNRRPDWLTKPNKRLSIFITFSKSEDWFYDVNEDDLATWIDYKNSFVIFVLGNHENLLIVPVNILSSKLHEQHKPTDKGNYKLHIIKEAGNYYFRELSDFPLKRYHNNFEQLNTGLSQQYFPERQAESNVREQESYSSLASEIPLQLERQLEEFLALNLDIIESGLTLYRSPGGRSGRQFHTPIGIIDLLCQKVDGTLLVIELKRLRVSDVVVGQISRYIGWVKRNIAGNGSVQGLILSHESDESLKYAVIANPNITLQYYKLRLELITEDDL